MNWDRVRTEDQHSRSLSSIQKFERENPRPKLPYNLKVLDKKNKCYECKAKMKVGEWGVNLKIGKFYYFHHPACAGIDLPTPPIEEKKRVEKQRNPKNGIGPDGNLYKSGYQIPLHKR